MPSIEVDIKIDKLAAIGYRAFWNANKELEVPMRIPTWDQAPVPLRNFWYSWAKNFTQIQMGIK